MNSFRQRWSITFSGPGAEETGQAGTFEMFAEYVRDPIAARVQMTDQQGAIAFEVVRIQEQAWFGGEGMPWQEVPAGSVPFDPSDMMMMGGAFFAPDAATGMDGLFARVDTEELNGRQTVHYSMDVTDLFALMRQTDPTMSDAELTDGRLDYWVDQSGRFIVKYEMVIEGSGLDADFDDFDDDELTTDQPMRMEMVFELFDFGADINIEPPQ